MDGFDQLAMNWRSALLGLIILCTLAALVSLMRRGIERRAVIWFVVFVLSGGVSAIPMVIGFAGAYDIWPGLTFLPTQMALFYGPAIALHARELILGRQSRRTWWLFAPGIVYWLYQLWAFTMLGDYRAKWAFTKAVQDPYIYPIAMGLAFGLAAACLFHAAKLQRGYVAWLKDNHSNDEHFSPRWITHLVVLSAIVAIFWACEFILARWFGYTYAQVFIWDFVALFAVFVISLEALAGIDRPFPKMTKPDPVDTIEPPEKPERDWAEEGERLKAEVLARKWHLEPGLSLQILARRFGTNQAYLSRAINQGLGQNFSSFINGLRVDYAKELIRTDATSMIDIAMETGFGSKASFNRAFKMHAGINPSEFKRRCDAE
ncbi:MAG: AraC family transcriptional regulator [Erythrobacter sp.]